MGIKNWIVKKFDTKISSLKLEEKYNPYSDSSFFGQSFSQTFAGVDVNASTAIMHQDVYTCIRIKSEAVGQLPMTLFRNANGKREKITSGREFKIFTQRPNAYQTWQELNEMYVTTMELRGNFYAEIKRNSFGNVYEIAPFRYQDNISVNMNSLGQVYYTYSTNDNKSGQSIRTYQNNQILHIKNNSLDGYRGMSPISYTAKSIAGAIAGEKHANSLFENGAKPSGVLTTDESFGDDFEAVERLRKNWNDMHSGSNNTGKTAILENGMTYKPIQMSAVDTQLLEQRKLSREQISSIFRVPIQMLNAASGLKYNTIEQTNIAFFRDSLMPLVTKLENAISPLLPDSHEIKLDQSQFVRGDRTTQVSNVKTEIQMGTLSINEGRVELGYEPIDGGDVYVVATNNATYGTWDKLDEIQQANNGNLAQTNISPQDSNTDPNNKENQ